MYTDDTIMTWGRYKLQRLRDIPTDYLFKHYQNLNGVNDQQFKEYLLNNYERITKGQAPILDNSIPVSFICNKITFATKKLANDFKNKKRRPQKGRKTPLRAYECPRCSAWHLTSKTFEEYNELVNQHKQ